MNVAELVIKLLLDGAGVKSEAARVDDALADVEKQAKDAGKSLDQSADAGAAALKDVQQQADKAGKALTDMGRDGERSIDALDRMAERFGSGLLSVAKRVGGALAALWSIDAIQATAAAYYEQATAIDQTAQSLGVSIERLQAWQGAAATVGGEAEEIADRFRDLSDYIIDATKFDSGPLKDIAAELGIELKNASGEARSTEDVMLDLADAFQRVGTQASTAYGMQMSFDPATIALLQKGRGELEMLLKVQQENAAFSKEDAELARKQKIAVMALSMAWQGFVNGLMRLASPIITAITEGLGKVTEFLSRNSRTVGITLTAIATVITATLVPALAGMATAAWATIAPFAPFIAAAVALGLALDDLWTFVEGGSSAFEVFLRWLGATDEQVEHTRELFRALAGVLGGFGDLLASAFTFDGAGILEALQTIYDQASEAWASLLRVFGAGEDTIEAVGTAVSSVGGVLEGVYKLFESLFSLDGNVILGALTSLQDALSSMMGAFGNLLGVIKEKLVGLLPDWMKDWLGVDGAPDMPAVQELPGVAAAASAPAGGGARVTNSNVQTSTSIGTINVQTQASDAQGIARDIGTELRNQTAQADGAYGA